MTIQELANELNMLIEAGYGDAKAVVGIPTVFITEDGDIWKNDYRDVTKDIEFSAKFYIENKADIDPGLNIIRLHNASYEECNWEDYYDDCEKEEGEEEKE